MFYTYLGLEDVILLASTEKAGSSTASLYVDGQQIDSHLLEINSSRGIQNFKRDHLGSVLNSGAEGGKAVYGIYGRNLGIEMDKNALDRPVVYGFTGREFDPESNFYYYRARNYDPETGRFLTKDPIGLKGGDTNLYRYVGNNPVNFADPMGLVALPYSEGADSPERIRVRQTVNYLRGNHPNIVGNANPAITIEEIPNGVGGMTSIDGKYVTIDPGELTNFDTAAGTLGHEFMHVNDQTSDSFVRRNLHRVRGVPVVGDRLYDALRHDDITLEGVRIKMSCP